MDIDDSRHHWRNRYLLMRHGHSQANAQGTIISSPERGLLAYGLSPQGEQQLADTVARWHWPVPTQVVHSDFLRTTHTAARVAAAFGLEMQKEERLRERHFGELEGKADSHYPEVWAFDAQNADHTQWQVEPVKRVAGAWSLRWKRWSNALRVKRCWWSATATPCKFCSRRWRASR